MNTKVCFKGDGTEDTGKKIIKALELIGVKELKKEIKLDTYTGAYENYYHVANGRIYVSLEPPSGFPIANVDKVLAELTKSKEKPYPKWMHVGSNKDYINQKRFVLCVYNNSYWAIDKGSDIASGAIICEWEYANDIDENAEKREELEKELAELNKRASEIQTQLNELERK